MTTPFFLKTFLSGHMVVVLFIWNFVIFGISQYGIFHEKNIETFSWYLPVTPFFPNKLDCCKKIVCNKKIVWHYLCMTATKLVVYPLTFTKNNTTKKPKVIQEVPQWIFLKLSFFAKNLMMKKNPCKK